MELTPSPEVDKQLTQLKQEWRESEEAYNNHNQSCDEAVVELLDVEGNGLKEHKALRDLMLKTSNMAQARVKRKSAYLEIAGKYLPPKEGVPMTPTEDDTLPSVEDGTPNTEASSAAYPHNNKEIEAELQKAYNNKSLPSPVYWPLMSLDVLCQWREWHRALMSHRGHVAKLLKGELKSFSFLKPKQLPPNIAEGAQKFYTHENEWVCSQRSLLRSLSDYIDGRKKVIELSSLGYPPRSLTQHILPKEEPF